MATNKSKAKSRPALSSYIYWQVNWLRGQDVSAAQLIEDALRHRHNIKPPINV